MIEFEIVETTATRYALGPAALAAAGLPAELAALQDLPVDDVFESLQGRDVQPARYEVRERWLLPAEDAEGTAGTEDTAEDAEQEAAP